jgi:uncharacterized protein YbjQ (UPF0145 family)
MKPISIVLLTALFTTGCAQKVLSPGADQVQLVHKTKSTCNYLGDVFGSHGNFLAGQFISNVELEKGAVIDLKNNAQTLGANRVVVIASRAGETGRLIHTDQTNVVYSGEAYACPPTPAKAAP